MVLMKGACILLSLTSSPTLLVLLLETRKVSFKNVYRLLDNLEVECWHRVREVLGSIPSQGPRHTKDVIKMVPVVPLFSTQQ